MEIAQFRVLYREFLFRIVDLEILSAQADVSKLLGQFAAMLAALSLMFCGGALRIIRAEIPPSAILVSAWVDEHFLIATTMAVVGLFAVLSWNTALPNRRDVLVLAPLPIPQRTLFLSKLAATGSVLTLTVVALNVFSGVSYPFAIGLAGGGFIAVVQSFAAYWFTMLAASAFMFSLLLAIQGATALLLSRQRSLRISAVFQLAAFCAILTVYFLQPALATPRALADPDNARLIAWLPSYWFLGLFQQLNGSAHEALSPLATRAWVGLIASAGGVSITLLLSYFRTMRKIVEEPDIEPGRYGRRWSLLLGHSLRTAIFEFCVRTLFRSHQHRVILAFYLGIGFAISIAYGRTVLYGLYGYSGTSWNEVNRPVLVATVVMACFAVVETRVAFALPMTLPANWIFRTAVARPAPQYLAAIREVLLLLTVMPVVGLSLALLLSIWPPWPVVGHGLLLALLGLILVELCLLRFRKVPFTCSYLPGKAQIHVTAGACILVLVALTDIGVEFETYALQHPVRYALMLGPVAVLAALIRWRTSEEIAASDVMLRFEEQPASTLLTLDIELDGVMSQAGPPGLGRSPRSFELALRAPASAWRWPIRIGSASVGLVALLLASGTAYQRLPRTQLGVERAAVLKLGSLRESSKPLTTKENRREETVPYS